MERHEETALCSPSSSWNATVSGWLPFEVVVHLLLFVDVVTLERVCPRVCRMWRNAAFMLLRRIFPKKRFWNVVVGCEGGRSGRECVGVCWVVWIGMA